jgi:stalled ribosome rescue protein Dom34
VGAVLERSGAHGKGVTGIQATREAMQAGAVHEVLLTSAFIDRQPDDAEDVVRAAMAQRARVELVSGNGAMLLDNKAEGVGALLRFTTAVAPDKTSEHARAAGDA